MEKATVRDLRYRFPHVETLLQKGEEVQIAKHRRVIAGLVPELASAVPPCLTSPHGSRRSMGRRSSPSAAPGSSALSATSEIDRLSRNRFSGLPLYLDGNSAATSAAMRSAAGSFPPTPLCELEPVNALELTNC